MLKQSKSNKKISVKDLIKDIDLPKENQSIFTIENNGNSIFDYFLNICSKEKINSASIISYRISKKDLVFLEEIKSIYNFDFKYRLLLSDSIPSMVVGTFNYLKDNNNFNVIYKNTHIKLCLIKTEKNNYSIFSSGNFNPDGKLEQLQIFNNKDIFENYNKSKLWQGEKEI
jgi:hypothetical protein